MIRVVDLGFAYPGHGPALESISFSLEEGALLCVAGANGSGKSTLLSLLAGLLRPTAGHIELAGLSSPGSERRFREKAGLLLQEPDLQILGATVAEDLLLGSARGDPVAVDRARTMARRFGLLDCWDAPVHTLSHGQKRKLCLAATLLGEPETLLLDEPFSGLDYPAVKEMRSLLESSREQGLAQIVAVHDLEPLSDVADLMAVLAGGRLALWGPPADVLDRVADYGVRQPCSWQAGLGVRPWR